jgi:hypothetical protein
VSSNDRALVSEAEGPADTIVFIGVIGKWGEHIENWRSIREIRADRYKPHIHEFPFYWTEPTSYALATGMKFARTAFLISQPVVHFRAG